MILRNLSAHSQKIADQGELKDVSPAGLVAVSAETGFRLLASAPAVWVTEQALVPPPPPASPA